MTLEGWHRRVVLVLAIALGAPACGPIQYTSTVTFGASNALDAARAVNAAKWSPYWWTRATQYLHKSREEAAYSNFEAANHFGRLAREAAVKAREEAIRRAADPEAAKELEPPTPGGGGGLAPALDDDEPSPAPAKPKAKPKASPPATEEPAAAKPAAAKPAPADPTDAKPLDDEPAPTGDQP